MKAKLHHVLTTSIFLMVFSSFGQNIYFTKVESKNALQKSSTSSQVDDKNIVYEFDYDQLSNMLSKNSKLSKTSDLVLSLPNLDGEFEKYRVEEASVFHPDLQAKYPEIKSYVGYSINSPSAYLRFSLSPYKGLTGIILGNGKALVIKPDSKKNNQITITNKSSINKKEGFKCLTENTSLEQTLKSSLTSKDADDSLKRTYKLALSVTGEYAAFHGGTLASVNASLAATLVNINAVFENDFNVSLQLIETNDSVIFLNSETDPYSNLSNYSDELQTTLDTEILETNYDIGHLLAASDFDGNAGCIGCVCINGLKGSGYTSDTNPEGFNFDIDLVAHEIGHQFGANHTWTHDGNEGSNVQMEPGSGTTIMGYAGITGATNVQTNSDPYFHAISIEQVTTYIKSTSCATTTNTGNTTPTVDAGSNLTLPIGTPFKLVGTGGDIDGDLITYCWEQINENNALTTYPDENSADSNSVLFRSYPPTINDIRYFPNLSDLKFGMNSTQWEKIPNVNRTADFRLTVRDNKPGGANNKHDDMRVTFDNSYGPFEVTSQNTSGIEWTSGTNEIITWSVNNTNSLPGASNVNILLSTDGGETYNTIVNNIPNNGSYSLTVPKTPAPYCRIMIEPTNNNFLAINSENFAIDYTVSTTCNQQFSSNSNLNLLILDNQQVSNSINIPTNGTINDVKINVNVSHTFISDLIVTLTHPNTSTNNVVWNKNCFTPSGYENFDITFEDNTNTIVCGNNITGTYTPLLNPLNVFNGLESSGNWTLSIFDSENGDEGILNDWYIELCITTAIPLDIVEPDFVNFPEFSLFPNPSSDKFKIQLSTESTSITVNLFDISGYLVYETTYNNLNGNFDEEISLNYIQSGMYLMRINDGIRESTKKLIIK